MLPLTATKAERDHHKQMVLGSEALRLALLREHSSIVVRLIGKNGTGDGANSREQGQS